MSSSSKQQNPQQQPETPPADSGKAQKRSREWQQFQAAKIRRSQVSPYENNPRVIDKHAYKKLRESLRKTGLVEGLVVNRREDGSLVLVGGHQRMRAMDDVSKYSPDDPATDYEIPISLIQVPLAREAELVVSLNNPGMQGQFEAEALARLCEIDGVSPETMGFERMDLSLLVGHAVADKVFGVPESSAAKQEVVEAPVIDMLSNIKQAGSEVAAAQRTAEADRAKEIERMKSGRAEFIAKQAKSDSTEFMLMVVFDSAEQMDRFMESFGLPTTERYISGVQFSELIGVPLDGDESLDPGNGLDSGSEAAGADEPEQAAA